MLLVAKGAFLSGHNELVTTTELERLAEELGIDAIGAAPAEPYEETERHIRERREQGLFADMRFTMARPEVSCHPESLLPGARTVISAALCYYAPETDREPGEGRLPRYTWFDAYAELREKLDALGRRLGGEYRVLVDENDHVDREAAARSGVGFYGKNTMLITRRHGSWVVLGRSSPKPSSRRALVSRSTAAPARSASRPVRPARSTIRARSTRRAASGTGPRLRARSRGVPHRDGAHVYGCDICQDVCPWNRGIEKRRAGETTPADAEPHVSLVEWLELSDDELRTRYERLYFPRNDPRYLRRNALVALGNSGSGELRRRPKRMRPAAIRSCASTLSGL